MSILAVVEQANSSNICVANFLGNLSMFNCDLNIFFFFLGFSKGAWIRFSDDVSELLVGSTYK